MARMHPRLYGRLATLAVLALVLGSCGQSDPMSRYMTATTALCAALQADIEADYPREQTIKEATRLVELDTKVTEAEAAWGRAVPPEVKQQHDALANSLHPMPGRREFNAAACAAYMDHLTVRLDASVPGSLTPSDIAAHARDALTSFQQINEQVTVGEQWLRAYLDWTATEQGWTDKARGPECAASMLASYRKAVDEVDAVFEIGLRGLRESDSDLGARFRDTGTPALLSLKSALDDLASLDATC